jgi:hypothetical protein
MRHLKMLGLAAVAALALMAFGAGSASATELCSTNTSPCSGTKYGSGTVIKASLRAGMVANFTSSLGNITCTGSSIGEKTTGGGGAGVPVKAEIISLTFSGCTQDIFGSPNCGLTAIGLPTPIEMKATEEEGNGTMTTGAAGAEAICLGFLECSFSTPEVKLAVTGGNPAHITASNAVLIVEEGTCPAETRLDATYEVTTPKPLFLVNP